jgi:SNF2-related domain/SWIM zinc finger
MTVPTAIVLAMQQVVTLELDLSTLKRAVGGGSYVRGAEYARQQAVRHASWDPADTALRGTVRGHGGAVYHAAAFFSLADGRPATFAMGDCSCPVAFNCKHVVALVLSALTSEPPESAGESSRPSAWEQSLDSLLDPGGSVRCDTTPLAIELSLAGGPGQPGWGGQAAPKLIARLVRAGKNGGWVAGGLSWGKLDALRYSGGYSEQQVRLLRELHVLFVTSGSRGGYYYYGADQSIEFSSVGSRQLWPLLDEAAAAGLQLVYPDKRGTLPGYEEAGFFLDVTRGEPGGLRIVPVIRTDDGEPAVPVTFIGAEGHGVVYIDRAQAAAGGKPASWRFRLARLARPVPPPLRQMALGGGSLDVPPAEEPRFLDRYYPRLRQAAALISSDGSFAPPAIRGPDLVLRADYGSGHEVEVSWEWAYHVGDSPRRAPLEAAGPDDGYRDLAAERALLTDLDLPLDRYGLVRPGNGAAGSAALAAGPAAPALAPRVRLTGLGTMRFSTELLPLLADRPGLIVEVSGEPADYREAGDTLQITVSTDEVAGDTDWFDLGVMISVAGHPVPFLEVFLALSRGESHLLLPDGAFFSLDKPELRALARLISEARALQDSPAGSLRISRYQASFWDELAALGVIGHQAAAWREQVKGLLSAADADRAGPPAGLLAQLRPYQQDGFGWLTFLWEHRLGGILADDMGLGKTLQCLALIRHARQRDPADGPFLIVAPTSVVANWAAEAARFTPGLKVVPVASTVARRGRGLGELIAGADAVVTSYALLRIDFAAYAAVGWSGLLLDEAQQAKNRQSKIYQCVRRLTAPVKIAITGTPMENNLMELWSLLSITAPGLFPSPERFRDYSGGGSSRWSCAGPRTR